jgi:hypothetical protein
MKHTFAVVLLLSAGALLPAAGAAQPGVTGAWEAARTANDERLYIVLGDKGKAEVVEEYLLPMPGKQRARSSTFGKWTRKGNDVVVTYGNITDRLRYVAREPLTAVGRSGSAPALKPVGKPSSRSKIGSEVLWKAPHEYRIKADESTSPAVSAPEEGSAPAK